jgi:type VI secretion system Hcp family effector
LKFSYGVVSPRDVFTGQASGKRQHKAIVITKEPGAATPQFFAALVSNEMLKSIVSSAGGGEENRSGYVSYVEASFPLSNAAKASKPK